MDYPSYVYPSLTSEHQEKLESRNVLLIDRHVTQEVLTAEACLDVLERAYKEEGNGSAVNRTKTNIHIPTNDSLSYRYCTMEGGIRTMGVVAIRIKSDMVTHRYLHGQERVDWHAVYPGRFMGLILLFSAKDGALLSIMHDAHVQHMRVAGTDAIAAREMSRRDSSVMGLLGSGGMAWTHLQFFRRILPIRRVKVYSPNPEHRERFARDASEALGIEVVAVQSSKEAIEKSDLVVGCTNAHEPVIRGQWLGEGTHVNMMKIGELDEDGYRRLDKHVLYVSPPGMQGTPCDNLFTFKPDKEFVRRYGGGSTADTWNRMLDWVGKDKVYSLPDVLLKRVKGRDNDGQITGFRNEGTGVQFAAVALKVYEEAKKRGLGRELPLDWFLQDVTD